MNALLFLLSSTAFAEGAEEAIEHHEVLVPWGIDFRSGL